jgi:raffinose/stachyose/melibiose transport system permease protein
VAADGRSGPPGEPRLIGYLYVAPALLVFGAFLLWPILRAVWLSLYEWDGLSVGTWVGLDNYVAVVTDPALRAPFWHAAVLVVFFCVIPVTLGLTLAGLMSRVQLAGMGFFRVVLFLPQVVAMVVVGIAWQAIYAPSGPLNDALRAVGLDSWARGWLGDTTWALPSVGLVGTWVATGLCLVLFLSGLAKVPRELYEAARVDGAGPVREFLTAGLPSLRGELAVALTLTMIAALRTFDLVYVMTSGGPGGRTAVPAYEVYRRTFEQSQVGIAMAVAIVLTLVILAVTVAINRIAEGAER